MSNKVYDEKWINFEKKSKELNKYPEKIHKHDKDILYDKNYNPKKKKYSEKLEKKLDLLFSRNIDFYEPYKPSNICYDRPFLFNNDIIKKLLHQDYTPIGRSNRIWRSNIIYNREYYSQLDHIRKNNRPFKYIHNKESDKLQLWKVKKFEHENITKDLIPIYNIYKEKYKKDQQIGNRSHFMNWLSPAEEAFIFGTMMRDLYHNLFENDKIIKDKIIFPYNMVELQKPKDYKTIDTEAVDEDYFIESEGETEWENNDAFKNLKLDWGEIGVSNNKENNEKINSTSVILDEKNKTLDKDNEIIENNSNENNLSNEEDDKIMVPESDIAGKTGLTDSEEDDADIFKDYIAQMKEIEKTGKSFMLKKKRPPKEQGLLYPITDYSYSDIKCIRKRFKRSHMDFEFNFEEFKIDDNFTKDKLEEEKDDLIENNTETKVETNSVPNSIIKKRKIFKVNKTKKERKKRTMKIINDYANMLNVVKELDIKDDIQNTTYKITVKDFDKIKEYLDNKQLDKAKKYMITHKINIRKLDDFYIKNNNVIHNLINIEDELPGINRDNPLYIFKFDLIFGYDKTKINVVWKKTDKYIFVKKGYYTDRKHNIGIDISDKYLTPIYTKMEYYTCIVFEVLKDVYITYICLKFIDKYQVYKKYFDDWLMLSNDEEKFYYIRSGNYGNRNIVFNETIYPRHENFIYDKEPDKTKVNEYSHKPLYGNLD